MLNITDESSDSAETQMFPEMFPLGGGRLPPTLQITAESSLHRSRLAWRTEAPPPPPEVALLLLLICRGNGQSYVEEA